MSIIENDDPWGTVPEDDTTEGDGNVPSQNDEGENLTGIEDIVSGEGEGSWDRDIEKAKEKAEEKAKEVIAIGAARFGDNYDGMARTLGAMFEVTVDYDNRKYSLSEKLEDGRTFTATYTPLTKEEIGDNRHYMDESEKPVAILELTVIPDEGKEEQFGLEIIDKDVTGKCNTFKMYGGPGGCINMEESKEDRNVMADWVGQQEYMKLLPRAFDSFVIGYIQGLPKDNTQEDNKTAE